MKRELISLAVLVAFTTAAGANVWNPNEEVTRSFENEDYEIIVKDLESGSGTLEAKANQVGKRTMYLEPAPKNEMLETCNILYGSSVTTESNPCPEYASVLA